MIARPRCGVATGWACVPGLPSLPFGATYTGLPFPGSAGLPSPGTVSANAALSVSLPLSAMSAPGSITHGFVTPVQVPPDQPSSEYPVAGNAVSLTVSSTPTSQ